MYKNILFIYVKKIHAHIYSSFISILWYKYNFKRLKLVNRESARIETYYIEVLYTNYGKHIKFSSLCLNMVLIDIMKRKWFNRNGRIDCCSCCSIVVEYVSVEELLLSTNKRISK